MGALQTTTPGRSRLKLLVLFVLFLLPVVAAYVLYFSGWRSAETINYGELVQPPRSIGDVDLSKPGGESMPFHRLRGKWTLVYFAPDGCDAACVQALQTMRQAHAAQGREMERVQRVMIISDSLVVTGTAAAIEDNPRLIVLRASAAKLRELSASFITHGRSPLEGPQRIYLVDPLGNLVLSYPPGANASGMRKDLARLLRVSQVG